MKFVVYSKSTRDQRILLGKLFAGVYMASDSSDTGIGKHGM